MGSTNNVKIPFKLKVLSQASVNFSAAHIKSVNHHILYNLPSQTQTGRTRNQRCCSSIVTSVAGVRGLNWLLVLAVIPCLSARSAAN